MNDTEWNRALGLIESNSRAIAALSDTLESERVTNRQRIESNSRAIAALADKVVDHHQTFVRLIEANSKAIADLTEVLGQLQNGQAMLTQLISEQQTLLKEFRQIFKALLERVERGQTQSDRNLDTIGQEITDLRQSFLSMHQELLELLQGLEKRTDRLFSPRS